MPTKKFDIAFSSLLRRDMAIYVEGEEVMRWTSLDEEVIVLYVGGGL